MFASWGRPRLGEAFDGAPPRVGGQAHPQVDGVTGRPGQPGLSRRTLGAGQGLRPLAGGGSFSADIGVSSEAVVRPPPLGRAGGTTFGRSCSLAQTPCCARPVMSARRTTLALDVIFKFRTRSPSDLPAAGRPDDWSVDHSLNRALPFTPAARRLGHRVDRLARPRRSRDVDCSCPGRSRCPTPIS
jgi:hypothetical protein